MKKNVFLLVPELRHDGLSQYSVRARSIAGDPSGKSVITASFTLPPQVLPTYWLANELSEKDVLTIGESLPANLFWLTTLFLGIDASASAIKPSYASAEDILISSKAIGLRKLLKNLKFSKTNKLDTTSLASQGHVPPLPKHIISQEFYNRLREAINPGLRPFIENEVPNVFEWANKLWIPLRLEDQAISVQRCVPLETFITSGKYTGSLATKPFVVRYNDILYALIEDTCLLLVQ